MAYLEGICMVEGDTYVVWDQFNTEGPMGPAFCARGRTTIKKLRGRDSWRVTTPHVQSFVLISMLRGQPKTPPSGDDLAVLDYHLKLEDICKIEVVFEQQMDKDCKTGLFWQIFIVMLPSCTVFRLTHIRYCLAREPHFVREMIIIHIFFKYVKSSSSMIMVIIIANIFSVKNCLLWDTI